MLQSTNYRSNSFITRNLVIITTPLLSILQIIEEWTASPLFSTLRQNNVLVRQHGTQPPGHRSPALVTETCNYRPRLPPFKWVNGL